MWQYLAAHGFLCEPAGTKLEPFTGRFEAIESVETHYASCLEANQPTPNTTSIPSKMGKLKMVIYVANTFYVVPSVTK